MKIWRACTCVVLMLFLILESSFPLSAKNETGCNTSYSDDASVHEHASCSSQDSDDTESFPLDVNDPAASNESEETGTEEPSQEDKDMNDAGDSFFHSTEGEEDSNANDSSQIPLDDSSLADESGPDESDTDLSSIDISNIDDSLTDIPVSEEIVRPSDSTYFDVTWPQYGANGNDLEDDANQINIALYQAALTAASMGKTVEVFVPAGKYYLGNVLLIYSNTWLHLDPSAEMIRTDLTREMLAGVHRNSNNVVCYEECDHYGYEQVVNTKVSGGRWNGGVESDNCGGPIYSRDIMTFRHAANLTISDTVIGDDCSIHSVVLDGIRNITVSNVTFQNHYRYTGSENAYYLSGDKKIDPSTFGEYWTYEALHIDEINDGIQSTAYPLEKLPSVNVRVENCSFRNVVVGLGTHNYHEDNPCIGVIIRGNTFNKVLYNCINAFNFKDMDVLYNKAYNVTGFIFGKDCATENKEYSYIQYNTVECSRLPGIPVQDTIRFLGKSKVFIEDNIFRNIQAGCIWIDEGSESKTDTSYSQAVINLNLMENAAGLAGENVHYAAIRIGRGCSARLWKNKIYLQEHTRSGCETSGVIFKYSAKGCWMSKNIIHGGDVGIYVNETNGVELTRNEVKWTKKFGVYCVRSNDLALSGNLFMSNNSCGFMFDNCNDASSYRNSALWNGKIDLKIENSKNIGGLNTFNANTFSSSDNQQTCLKYIQGDINFDGKFSLLDIQDLQRFVSHPDNALRSETYMGDIDLDSTLTENDISLMMKKLAT